MVQQRGLVMSRFGNRADVWVEDTQETVRCPIRKQLDALVPGDYVSLALESNEWVVEALEPRRSELARPDYRGVMKPIAANIDQVAVVVSFGSQFSLFNLDRYLCAIELLNLDGLVILNKVDLLRAEQCQSVYADLSPYNGLGYPVVQTSVLDPNSLDLLNWHLKDKTSVFVGTSGVGKSSLINECVPDELVQAGEVSKQDLGRHTTTVARLYHLPQGGMIIDSPGIREFNLWSLRVAQLQHGFKEIADFSDRCKFRNCQHLKEPSCAVLEAVEQGLIAQSRLNSYQRLLMECENLS